MPIYEFYCRKCKTIFETLMRGADKIEAISCPLCNGKKVKKLMSIFSGGKSDCDSCA